MLKLIFPNLSCKEEALSFIREFHEKGSAINGTGGLDRYLQERSFEEWLGKVFSDIDIANVPKDRVPALTYFYADDVTGRIVGMVNIRLALSDFLRKEGGHIGYCVRPDERRRGYGTAMLREALAVCRRIGITSVLVFCDVENVASVGVVENCGGIMEEEFYSDTYQETIRRYRIDA